MPQSCVCQKPTLRSLKIKEMYNLLRDRLQDATTKELANNSYATGLLFLLNNQTNIPTVAQLVAIPTQTTPVSQTSESSPAIELENKDFRFLELYLKGIRKFPSGDNQYCINFTNAGQPVSSVFLGSNGIGKSSLFSSLEYIALGHSYLADERGYESLERQKDYLKHNNTNEADTLINLHTRDKEFNVSLANEVSPIVPPAFFCSEYDIQEISRKGLNSDYICKQLGLQRFHDLLQRMKAMRIPDTIQSAYDERSAEIQTSIRRLNIMRFLTNLTIEKIQQYNDFLTSLKSPLESANSIISIVKILRMIRDFTKDLLKDIPEDSDLADDLRTDFHLIVSPLRKVATLKAEDHEQQINATLQTCKSILTYNFERWDKEVTSILTEYERTNHRQIYQYLNQIFTQYHTVEALRDMINKSLVEYPLLSLPPKSQTLFNSTYHALLGIYKDVLNNYINIINRILPPVFSKYFDKDINGITANVSEDGFTIEVKIETCNPLNKEISSSTEPRKFLNTFRFKMFCFVLKFALTCCIKKFHKVNFPFTIDDVFDASDFENRTDIGRLISDLKEKHDNIEGLNNLPMQLIFFTQDNVIAEAIRVKYYPLDEIKFSCLFDYYAAKESDKTSHQSHGITYVHIEDIL